MDSCRGRLTDSYQDEAEGERDGEEDPSEVGESSHHVLPVSRLSGGGDDHHRVPTHL